MLSSVFNLLVDIKNTKTFILFLQTNEIHSKNQTENLNWPSPGNILRDNYRSERDRRNQSYPLRHKTNDCKIKSSRPIYSSSWCFSLSLRSHFNILVFCPRLPPFCYDLNYTGMENDPRFKSYAKLKFKLN